MPCYDPRSDVDPTPYKTEIDQLKNVIDSLEAGLCAVITELEQRGIAYEILSHASKRGLIDLMSFWEKHSLKDEVRLAKELHKFSEHEQAILKKLINR